MASLFQLETGDYFLLETSDKLILDLEAFKLAASANITASGENTTVQLTAPSGKATSDFDAGRIQDDENPADAVDITADDYTEMEWCITANSETVIHNEIYDFRVTNSGTVLNTYTVTPKWTIDTGGGGSVVKDIIGMGIIPFAR